MDRERCKRKCEQSDVLAGGECVPVRASRITHSRTHHTHPVFMATPADVPAWMADDEGMLGEGKRTESVDAADGERASGLLAPTHALQTHAHSILSPCMQSATRRRRRRRRR